MRELLEIPSGKWKLHGMAHLPAETRGRRIGVVVVVGPTPKFGTHRLLVQVAEALAQEGFYALRYDSRGTCDSQGICDLTFAHRIADVHAVVADFRRRYRLDAVLGWGLCISGAVSLHAIAEAKKPEERFDGLILCNLLSHPSQAQQLPQLAYGRLDLRTAMKNVFLNENPLQKLWKVVQRSENWLRKGPTLIRRLVRPEQVLDQLRQAAPRVGGLLAAYDGPTLLVFGEKDRYWETFRDQVNPGDRLGLAHKKFPPAWAFVENGDHTFSSREQTAAMLRYTLDWVKPFLQGTQPGPVHSPLQLRHYTTEAPQTAWR